MRWLGLGGQTVKDLRRLACKFDLDQSERKSSQVNASAPKPWSNEVASWFKSSTCVSVWPGLYLLLCVQSFAWKMGRHVGITGNVHARSLFDIVFICDITNCLMLVRTRESLCLERGLFCDFCKGLVCIRTPCCLLNTALNFKSLLNPFFNLFTSLQIHSLRYGALRSVIFI